MSKKTFSEKLNEIVSNVSSKTKGGKMKPTFSKKMFSDVVNALVNDDEYVMETVQLKDGKPVNVVSTPVKEFRTKLLTPILEEVKMDRADIDKFIENYEFSPKQTEAMYDVMTSAIYEYMKVGKTFRFPSKNEFTASISLRKVEPSIYENEKRGIKVQRGEYLSLIKKSSCPQWRKTPLK